MVSTIDLTRVAQPVDLFLLVERLSARRVMPAAETEAPSHRRQQPDWNSQRYTATTAGTLADPPVGGYNNQGRPDIPKGLIIDYLA